MSISPVFLMAFKYDNISSLWNHSLSIFNMRIFSKGKDSIIVPSICHTTITSISSGLCVQNLAYIYFHHTSALMVSASNNLSILVCNGIIDFISSILTRIIYSFSRVFVNKFLQIHTISYNKINFSSHPAKSSYVLQGNVIL